VSRQRAWLDAIERNDPNLQTMALEALRGCRRAIVVLQNNLARIGYPVTNMLLSTPPDLVQRLGQMEVDVPPILKLFWTEVGGIALVDLAQYAHKGYWADRGADAECCDGLYVYACDEDLADDEDITIGPDCCAKDNISGDGPYRVVVGNGWKPALVNVGGSGFLAPRSEIAPLDFLGYLRTTILECAGFPGLLGDPAVEQLRPQLLDGVPVF
jgi:hypothetical protein